MSAPGDAASITTHPADSAFQQPTTKASKADDDRRHALLARVLAHARKPARPVLHEGLPVIEIVGVRRVHVSSLDGQVRCWSLDRVDGESIWQLTPDRAFGLHPAPAGDHWLRTHVEQHLATERSDDLAATSAAPALLAWLLRRVRRSVDPVAMRRQVSAALGLDPEMLRLARHFNRRAEWTERSLVSAEAWNFAVRHRAALLQIEREAPAMLALYASLLLDRELIVHDPCEAVQAVQLHLARQGIRPATWRLALRSGRRLQLAVRQWYRGSLHAAIVEHLLRLQDFGLNDPPAPELIDSIWSRDGNSCFRWPEFRKQVQPHAAVYGHVARVYGSVKALTPEVDRPTLREAMHRVIGWVHGARITTLQATQRRAGWPWLVKAAQGWQDEQAARERLTCDWPVPNPVTVGRYRFLPLGSEFALWEEGRTMHHCAADRSLECLFSNALLASIRCAETGRRLATVQYGRRHQNYVVRALRGPVNGDPAPAVVRAATTAASVFAAWLAAPDQPQLPSPDGPLESLETEP